MKKYLLPGALLLALIIGTTVFITKSMMQLQIDKAVQIHIKDRVPLEAQIDSSILISLMNDLQTKIRVNDELQIRLNETFDVPLKMNLTVPLNTEVFMDQVLDLNFDLPVDINLDQTEMPLKDLVIPFNQKLMIRDSLDVDFSIPLDTKIRTNFKRFFNISLPVKATIPVKVKINQTEYFALKDIMPSGKPDTTKVMKPKKDSTLPKPVKQ